MAQTDPGRLDVSGDTSDPYKLAKKSINMVPGKTGLTTHQQMLLHKCEWDTNYPECPGRLEKIYGRIFESSLSDRFENVPVVAHSDLRKYIEKVHDPDLYENLRNICEQKVADMEPKASMFDAIYFNNETFDAAINSVDACITLAVKVAEGELQNGLVLCRPPGHHAMKSAYNGYCYFNNVAVTAQHLLSNNYAKKILIIDFDVHHGQGTQQAFYESDKVLYASIHRYEDGTFWPNLFESNFNFIGTGQGQGYNLNMPLNAIGMGDSEYIAIFTHIFLPIAYEFKPDLVLISGGYDASIGCPEGQMEVTPGCYQHIIQLLSGVAEGKIVVCLEGGYFLPSLAEGVACTLKGLLGDPCPVLDNLTFVHPKVIETMANLKRMLVPFWSCMGVNELFDPDEVSKDDPEMKLEIKYFGHPLGPPFLTRNCYPSNSKVEVAYYEARVQALRNRKYDTIPVNLPVTFCVHEAMYEYDVNPGTYEEFDSRSERQERLIDIVKHMNEMGVAVKMKKIPIHLHYNIDKYSPHVNKGWISTSEQRADTTDVYNESTAKAVAYSIAGLFCLIDEIMLNRASSGVGLVHPSDHTAEFKRTSCFRHANSIAFAANYLTIEYELQRVLIVDFDIHHGNGTQELFYTSPNVMYLSIHHYEDGSPAYGNYTFDGFGCGKGYNINIPFNKKNMGNTEYMAVFFHLILPIAYAYQPEFVLISAGFDAGVHDPLGGYLVTPEMFGHMVSLLRVLANGRLLLALEGDLNSTTTSLGMISCMKALRGDPLPLASDVYKSFKSEAIDTIRKVSCHFKQYFPTLQVMRPLPCVPVLLKNIDKFTSDCYDDSGLYKVLDMSVALDSNKVLDEVKKLQKNLQN